MAEKHTVWALDCGCARFALIDGDDVRTIDTRCGLGDRIAAMADAAWHRFVQAEDSATRERAMAHHEQRTDLMNAHTGGHFEWHWHEGLPGPPEQIKLLSVPKVEKTEDAKVVQFPRGLNADEHRPKRG
jgi:hypothetical protein